MAIAAEWLAVRAGSEKVFEAMAQAFPNADLYALTREPGVPFDFGNRTVVTTFLDRYAFLRDRRELTLPIMPLAWRTIDVRRQYDVVLTSSHAFAREFPPAKSTKHYCYVHAPMRYAWTPDLDARTRVPARGMKLAAATLRTLDSRNVSAVDSFAANSLAVRDRIRRFYGRDALVIHPPVDVNFFTMGPETTPRTRALAFSRFIPYKRLDLAIEACAKARVPLTVAGSGPQERTLRRLASDLEADVTFEIRPSDERVRELYRTSLCLLFPAEEDFGIVPVEAQACGTPVVGFDRGGIRDTVVHGETGLRVRHQRADLFADALRTILDQPLAPDACRRHAERFSYDRFRERLKAWLSDGRAT